MDIDIPRALNVARGIVWVGACFSSHAIFSKPFPLLRRIINLKISHSKGVIFEHKLALLGQAKKYFLNVNQVSMACLANYTHAVCKFVASILLVTCKSVQNWSYDCLLAKARLVNKGSLDRQKSIFQMSIRYRWLVT